MLCYNNPVNDELLLKQLDEIVSQEDNTRQMVAPADHRQLPQTLHARAWASERTQHIVWELPAEPRFQVSRGGLRRDWKWARPVAANITFLTLFILALVFWPHSRPRPTSAIPLVMPPSSLLAPQTAAEALSNSYHTPDTARPSAARSRAETPFAASPARPSLQTRPSLYAANPIRGYTPARMATPYPAGSYRVTSYRVAPAAPLAGSMPPMQSPY